MLIYFYHFIYLYIKVTYSYMYSLYLHIYTVEQQKKTHYMHYALCRVKYRRKKRDVLSAVTVPSIASDWFGNKIVLKSRQRRLCPLRYRFRGVFQSMFRYPIFVHWRIQKVGCGRCGGIF